ncbi:MAG: hypothetical protein JXR73_06950 [Candidatus Omnitrophica bacterium]|nr:hypothetical protein [Candidatus Omnitrophota bacterium]
MLFLAAVSADAQNLTPRPTSINLDESYKLRKTPTPLKRFELEMQRIVNVRLEAESDECMVFSDAEGYEKNKRLYMWAPGVEELFDTGEDGVSGSVIMPQDGRYMIFLHDETDSLRDINGDNAESVVMRMFHFATGQRLNLDIPARSATPVPGETRSGFEVILRNHFLVYTASDSLQNSQRDADAPWHIIDMRDIVYVIEGTPTPSPTFTPAGTPTPTPTPSPIPTPTPIPTVPPELRSNADINADGSVDSLDLLLFQYFWRQ